MRCTVPGAEQRGWLLRDGEAHIVRMSLFERVSMESISSCRPMAPRIWSRWAPSVSIIPLPSCCVSATCSGRGPGGLLSDDDRPGQLRAGLGGWPTQPGGRRGLGVRTRSGLVSCFRLAATDEV